MDEQNINNMNEGMGTVVEKVVANEGSGINLVKVAGWAGAVLALIAGGAVAWKLHTDNKAKKELHKPDKEIVVGPEDMEDVAAE